MVVRECESKVNPTEYERCGIDPFFVESIVSKTVVLFESHYPPFINPCELNVCRGFCFRDMFVKQ